MRRRSRTVAWALSVVLATFLANCVPVAASEQACLCCTSDGLQVVGAVTVAKAVPVTAPTTFVVLHAPALDLPNPSDLARYASSHQYQLASPGVPRHLLATTLLI